MSNRMLVSPDSTSTPDCGAVADRPRGAGAEDGQAHGSSRRACRRHGSGSAPRVVAPRRSVEVTSRASEDRGRPRSPRGCGPASRRGRRRASRGGSPSGVTTATVTAVSPPRSRASTASPTSAPPSSRTRSARCSSVARWPSCGSGRCGERLAEGEPLREALAEQRQQRAAQPDLDRGEPPAALVERARDRAGPASSRRAPRRARRASRRSVGSTPATSAAAPPAPRAIGRPPRRAPRSGCRPRRRARRSRPSAGAPASSSAPSRSAIADSPMPVSRSVTETIGRPRPRSTSRGSTQPSHIGRISRGGPGRATTTRPSGRSTYQPGAVPFSFGIALGGRDQPRLLAVRLGERQVAALEQLPQPGLEAPGSTVGVSPTMRGDRLAREVVRRRPEAARRDDEVGARERLARTRR